MTRKIVLLASGTRGDVQPYIALAQGLQDAGYLPTIATHDKYFQLVRSAGLEFLALGGNPSDLMTREGGQSALTYDGNLVRNIKATWEYMRNAQPVYRSMLTNAWLASQDADLIVAGLPSLWAVHIAEALEIPCIWAFLQPVVRTSHFPSAILPIKLPNQPILNWISHRVIEQVTWQPWRILINEWRVRELGLKGAPFQGKWTRISSGQMLVLNAYSHYIQPKPPDWPPKHHITGYWFNKAPRTTPNNTSIYKFLEQGRPVVYIGFGSPGNRQPEKVFRVITEVAAKLNIHAIVDLPETTITEGLRRSKFIMSGQGLPHDWIFQKVAAVIHHGGAGTTAASLRAGTPAVITPLAVDQFFWADRLTQLGASPPPIPQRAMSASKLAEAVELALYSPGLRSRTQELSELIRKEDGVVNAVQLIQSEI
jgi:UDP:flavonoid glycosyltransferase YjiC (YdhE family)